jgi:hypothetical protein
MLPKYRVTERSYINNALPKRAPPSSTTACPAPTWSR